VGRLRDAIAAAPVKVKRCKFGRFVDGLPAEDRAEMDELVADPEVQDWHLVNLCAAEFGFSISDTTIYRHRRQGGGCGCG
jgi:hypothetical protein